MAAADEHSEKAEQHRQAATLPDAKSGEPSGYSCGDTALMDQATSGGERLVQSVPCWDLNEESVEHHRYLADREQQLAAAERRTATRMVEAEIDACRGLSAREREHSPFAHRKEIASVIPHRETGTLRGVRVIFKPVPGLTAAWMRKAIECHRAKFERLGEPAIFLSTDPTLVARSTATVELRGHHLEVLISSDDDTSARVALDRARELVGPRTAVR